MAINNIINLDEKLSLTKRLRIAGQDYDVIISDEVDQALANYTNIEVSVQLRDMVSKLEKMDDVETTTADQYKTFTQNEIDSMRDSALATLDAVLGEGEGRRVYEFYGSSTKVLNTVIGLIQAELDKVMVERKKTADKHYSNRHKNNKKK
ncbi:hypothetical protein P7H00_13385 [Enterococcus pseudoavium]|uniref:Uncharacterized protein n=1 Tax=Enterococcus pseudoavium TaxID=44007 RepID=A0AAE4I4P6_9ENTE|nr:MULTISPECIES: hypothetical protein [Enterococcus]AXG38033.1 hypothetical protein EGCR1_04655 [Enterococcus gilvus]MDT2738102.1 hypothetical protein [Enterococcus pseudoavium]